jgi:MacB-like periplasmic core domain
MTPRFRRIFQFPWRSRATIAREVDVELQFHLDARVAELVAGGVLLRPLPFGDPGALVGVYSTPLADPTSHWDLSPPDLADFRARHHAFSGVAATSRQLATSLPRNAPPQIVNVVPATANTFHVLRVRAWRGRTFSSGEDAPGALPTAILSYGFWQRELGADSNVVGQTMTLFGRMVAARPRDWRGDGYPTCCSASGQPTGSPTPP